MIEMPQTRIKDNGSRTESRWRNSLGASSFVEKEDEALFILLNKSSIPLHAHYLSKEMEKCNVLDENDENLLVFAALANSLIGIVNQLKSLLRHQGDIKISLTRTMEGYTILTFGSNTTFAEVVEDLVRDDTLSQLKEDEGSNLNPESREMLVHRLLDLVTTKDSVETYFRLRDLIDDLKEHLDDKVDFIIVYDLEGNYITSTLKDPMAVTTFGKGILSRFVKREYANKTLVYDINDNIKLYYRSTGQGKDKTSLWHVGINNYVYVFFKHRIKHVPPGVISFRIESFINIHRERFDLPYPRGMLECANKYLRRTLDSKEKKKSINLEQHLISISSMPFGDE